MTDLIKFRETQHQLLNQIITYPSLYIWGSSCTGKTMTTTTVLTDHNHPFILVNCIELFSPNLIFNHIINDIYEEILNQNTPEMATKIGNNISLFTSLLQDAIDSVTKNFDPNFTVHIIFKNAERLINLSSDLLPFILLLPEKTNFKINVVLISKLPYDNLAISGELSSHRPVVLNFPNYKKEEFVSLLRVFFNV